MACPSPPTPSSAEYDESRSLVEDLQRLLGNADLADATAITSDNARVALHSSLLSARSPFFAIALRAPWHQPGHPLRLPYSSDVLHDVLEFLATGCVQLDSPAHAIRVARAAHALSADELCTLCSRHVHDTLTTPELLHAALSAASEPTPTDALPDALVSALRHAVSRAPLAALHAARDARAPALLLADAYARCELDARSVCGATGALAAHADAVRLVLRDSSPGEAGALRALLAAAPPSLFASAVEPAALLPPRAVLAKYRADAAARARGEPRSVAAVSRWVKVESSHPHGAQVNGEIRCVRVRGARAVVLRFDERSVVGKGAVLSIFGANPGAGTAAEGLRPLLELRSTMPESVSVLTGVIWISFRSGADVEWGWRFFAHPAPIFGACTRS